MNNEEIFTIGDKTNNGTISKFEIDSNGIRVFFEEKPKNYHVSLNSIKHVKQPIFTTEDGVDIYVGNIAWSVYIPEMVMYNPEGKLYISSVIHTNHKYFSTKEKAEEYILMNKPCLSIQDVLVNYCWCGADFKKSLKDFKIELKSLVKSRL